MAITPGEWLKGGPGAGTWSKAWETVATSSPYTIRRYVGTEPGDADCFIVRQGSGRASSPSVFDTLSEAQLRVSEG